MGGFYKQNETARDTLFALFPLSRDVEITVFDGLGRDTTFKGIVGDILVLQQDQAGEWLPVSCCPNYEVDESFVPVGDV